MQASLEGEAKGRAELLRIKKKLEGDINELEIALGILPTQFNVVRFPTFKSSLDHANKANADAQKNIKRYLEQIKEIQTQVEEEQRHRDELRDQLGVYEKRAGILQGEKDEVIAALEGVQCSHEPAGIVLLTTYSFRLKELVSKLN